MASMASGNIAPSNTCSTNLDKGMGTSGLMVIEWLNNGEQWDDMVNYPLVI